MVRLICTEIKNMMENGRSRLKNKLWLINFKTLDCSLHSVMPEPLCEVCGRLPDDTAESALISLNGSKNGAGQLPDAADR